MPQNQGFHTGTADVMRENGWIVGPEVATRRYSETVVGYVSPDGTWDVHNDGVSVAKGIEDNAAGAAVSANDEGFRLKDRREV